MDQWEQSPVSTTLGNVADQLSSRPITDDTLFLLPLTSDGDSQHSKCDVVVVFAVVGYKLPAKCKCDSPDGVCIKHCLRSYPESPNVQA